MKRLRLLTGCLLLAIALGACVASAPTDTSADSVEDAAVSDAEKEGGILTIGTGAVIQFDPIFVADDPSFHVVSQVFSFLFRLQGPPAGDPPTELIPDLATSWEYEDDTTLIFHLRQGVMWHDDNAVFAKGESREVVADDVVYSIKRALETEGNLTFGDFVAAYESVEAVDDYTVKLKLKEPDAILFARARGLSALGIVPHEAVELLGEDFALNPIGSGPFKFVEYKPDDSVKLVRNDLHYIRPHVDGVLYKIIPDADVAMLALDAGEIDMYNGSVPQTEVPRLSEDENYILYAGTCPVMNQLLFNMQNPLYSIKEFRQAIAHAIDGDAINVNVYGPAAYSGAGTAGPDVPGFVPDLRERYFQYDPEAAKALLAELGWTDSNGDGTLDKDGEPLKLPFAIWNMSPTPRVGEAIATQLGEIGIQVDLQTLEFGAYLDEWNAGADKMMYMGGWCGDGGTNGLWAKGSFASPLGYDDPEIFDLLDQANRTVDPAERDAILQEATEKIYSQYWAVPIGFYYFYSVSRSWVHDYEGTLWFENITTERNNIWLSRDK